MRPMPSSVVSALAHDDAELDALRIEAQRMPSRHNKRYVRR
jgi:hypothetical protein